MKSKYYLSGTILGLCLIPLVAIYLLSAKDLARFLVGHWSVLVVVAVGYLAALGAGQLADQLLRRRGIAITILVLVGVFIAGVLAGCLVNFLLNGNFRDSNFGLMNEAWSWFGKPAYALMLFGLPCAVVVAILNYLGHWLMGWWRKRNHYS